MSGWPLKLWYHNTKKHIYMFKVGKYNYACNRVSLTFVFNIFQKVLVRSEFFVCTNTRIWHLFRDLCRKKLGIKDLLNFCFDYLWAKGSGTQSVVCGQHCALRSERFLCDRNNACTYITENPYHTSGLHLLSVHCNSFRDRCQKKWWK